MLISTGLRGMLSRGDSYVGQPRKLGPGARGELGAVGRTPLPSMAPYTSNTDRAMQFDRERLVLVPQSYSPALHSLTAHHGSRFYTNADTAASTSEHACQQHLHVLPLAI